MFIRHKAGLEFCVTSRGCPTKLRRYYGAGYLHFITTSCYHRLPLLQKPPNRDLLLEVLEQVRRRYRFVVVGYVVMAEHLHLRLSEPERGDPSKVMQAPKQGFGWLAHLFSLCLRDHHDSGCPIPSTPLRAGSCVFCKGGYLKSVLLRGKLIP